MTMMQPETTGKKTKGFLDRLPKLGRVSQLVLVIGIFLLILVPLFIIKNQQPAKQTELNGNLVNLQKILSTTQTSKGAFEAELAQATAEKEAAKAVFPAPDQAPEILDSLLELAALNDIYVTSTAVSSKKDEGAIGPKLTIKLVLNGQISNFENFLLALDTKLPTSRINSFTFTVAGASAGQGYDTATITIDVLSYAGK
jgi:hypothetical protein